MSDQRQGPKIDVGRVNRPHSWLVGWKRLRGHHGDPPPFSGLPDVARLVPPKCLLGTADRMERPSPEEGFDERHHVWIDRDDGFVIEGWRDEDR
jgi:hypothetical protein